MSNATCPVDGSSVHGDSKIPGNGSNWCDKCGRHYSDADLALAAATRAKAVEEAVRETVRKHRDWAGLYDRGRARLDEEKHEKTGGN